MKKRNFTPETMPERWAPSCMVKAPVLVGVIAFLIWIIT